MIDYGEELPGSAGGHPEDDRALEDLLNSNPPKAAFFTHYHGDHTGRFMDLAAKNIPLYMGKVCCDAMANIHESLAYYDENIRKPREIPSPHNDALNVLINIKKKTFQDKDIVEVPGLPSLTVEAIRADHSAYDAYMFLITTPDGARILHTGDYRGHGWRSEGKRPVDELWERLGKKPVDYLITEGTMMSRQNEKTLSEKKLKEKANTLFQTHRHVFLLVSSTNPDSVASFCEAARENYMPIYGYSEYLKKQLETFQTASKDDNRPYDFSDIQTLNRYDRNNDFSAQEKEMESGFLAIVKMSRYYLDLINRFEAFHPIVIYSMWGGYLEPAHPAGNEEWRAFRDEFVKKYGDESFIHLHTGGHADVEMIKSLINKVCSADKTKEIIPIHTENAAGFLRLKLNAGLRQKIRLPAKLKERTERHRKLGIAEELLKLLPDGAELPDGILFRSDDDGTVVLELTCAAIGLDNPATGESALNMQADNAAFEAWALILHTHLGKSIRLAVEADGLPKDDEEYTKLCEPQLYKLNGKITPGRPAAVHYHRFLYRVMKFKEQFGDWFSLDTELEQRVEAFQQEIEQQSITFWGNRAENDAAKLKVHKDSQQSEKRCEVCFSGNLTDDTDEKYDWSGQLVKSGEHIFSQLPVGLFKTIEADFSKKHCIRTEYAFFTGSASAIDLWKLDASGTEMTIYELKYDNLMAGIITELMFYANYCHDMFVAKNRWKPAEPVNRDLGKSGDYHDRGYHLLYDKYKDKIDRVAACMLTDKLHPLIDKKVLDEMKRGGKLYGIEYNALHYDADTGTVSDENFK